MSQSLAKLTVHLIFSTKDRHPLITKELQPELNSYLAGILRNLKSPALIIASQPDHVHLLINLHREQAVSRIVMKLKANSSTWIKNQNPDLKSFSWQNGYGAFSVSESRLPAVKDYIAHQPEHHQKTSFQEELKMFLEKHHLEYDERHLWD